MKASLRKSEDSIRNILARTTFVLTIALLLMLGAPSARAEESVGTVVEVHGGVQMTHAGSHDAHLLKENDPVFLNDMIETDDHARVRIVFVDKTDLTVASKGKLAVDEYVYDPKKPSNNKSHFGITMAAFSYVGGLIDKGARPNVKLDLDFGSIGIRGTRIYRAMNHMDCWIYVEKGRITVSNDGGKVSLKKGQGTIMSAKNKAPVFVRAWTHKQIRWIKSQIKNP